MTPAQNAWGRFLTCAAGCGQKLHHPDRGRPRVVCSERCRCALRRQRRRLKASPWAGRYEWQEALEVWGNACAHCGERRGVRRANLAGPPVPLCGNCIVAASANAAPIQKDARLRDWLKRCAPGCPLPRPREVSA